MVVSIPIGKITADTSMQARVGVNMEVAEEYAEAIKGGTKMPPLIVFADGKTHWLADGWHRLQAYKNLGYKAVECKVHNGTREDAVLHAVGANVSHGLRRTNADKRRSVELLLTLPGWKDKPASRIAEQCGVDRVTAQSVIDEKLSSKQGSAQIENFTITKDGKRRPRKNRKPQPSTNGSGISVGVTAKKKDKALLDSLKGALKTLNKMPMDGASIADKFGRKKLGPHLDGAVAFMNELCAAFEIEVIDLIGVTDIPDNLNRDAWGAWLAYRKEAKLKAYTPTSAKKQMEALAKHPAEKQQEIVDTSIRNQYQGLFPSKDGVNGAGRQSGKSSNRFAESTAKLQEWAAE